MIGKFGRVILFHKIDIFRNFVIPVEPKPGVTVGYNYKKIQKVVTESLNKVSELLDRGC